MPDPDLIPARAPGTGFRAGPLPVVYVSATDELGGADASLCELVRCIDRERFTPHVVLPNDGPYTARYRAMGVRVHHVPLKKLKNTANPLWHAAYAARAPARVWRVARLLARIRPAVVHLNVSVELLAGLAARRYCSRRGAHLVWHVRELDLKPRAVENAVFGLVGRWADQIVTISAPLSRRLAGRGPVRVIHNGIDLGRFRPRTPALDRPPVLGWVGRVVPWKGIENVLQLFARVREQVPDARLLLQTSTVPSHEAYTEALRRRALASEHGAAIDWRGTTDTPEDAYAEMDLFVHLPNLQEPFGRTLVEAQAVGVPVLSWPHGGIADAVDADTTARLAPVGDLDAAVALAVEMLRDRAGLARMGAAASRFARDTFAAERHAERVVETYDALLATAAR